MSDITVRENVLSEGRRVMPPFSVISLSPKVLALTPGNVPVFYVTSDDAIPLKITSTS